MSTFLMLKDGKVAFEGSLDALRSSDDAYLRSFLGDQLALRR
jgi:ABC-type transporter Mla maintaining outer membrane lipid asymmetry ATPase subunit MlaF